MNPLNTLSEQQQHAYDKFCNGENLFITGPGGTGKTKLVKHLLEFSAENNKKTAVCAMTGCAAVLLNCNARTLHSWSGIKLARGDKDDVIESVLKSKSATKVWKSVKVLILDEVSMLSKKIFEIIEEIARRARNSPEPFGGIQVVFTGDFYQLPPVGNNSEPETEQFCFESTIWNEVFKQENHIELTTMFRQSDPEYIEILRQIRIGKLEEEKVKILQDYVNRKYDSEKHNGCIPTKLFPLRTQADFVNNSMFAKIKEKEFIFEIERKTDCKLFIDSNKPFPVELSQKCGKLSQREIDFELQHLINNIPCQQVLRIKKGAAVMCLINLDMENEICNGSQGVVIDINESGKQALPIVRFSNGIIKTIQPHYWQSDEYPTVAIGQYPLSLAWAMTIHKIQGATLSLAEMDLGFSIFEYGQTYVALSRIQSLDGLYLSAFHANKIKANPKVNAFYKRIGGTKVLPEPLSSPVKEAKVLPDPSSIFDSYKYKDTKDSSVKVIRL